MKQKQKDKVEVLSSKVIQSSKKGVLDYSKWDNLDYSSEEECDTLPYQPTDGLLGEGSNANAYKNMMEYLIGMDPERALMEYEHQQQQHLMTQGESNGNQGEDPSSSTNFIPTFDTIYGKFHPSTSVSLPHEL